MTTFKDTKTGREHRVPSDLPWTQHPTYDAIFESWFRVHPQVDALNKEYMASAPEMQQRHQSVDAHERLLAAIEANEADRKYHEDYASLRGRLRVVFDRQVADLRERFEACKFPSR